MSLHTETRVFFVVDAAEVNEELFTTYGAALAEFEDMERLDLEPRLYVALVNNAYRDGEGWNYDDQADTFNIIKVLKGGETWERQ